MRRIFILIAAALVVTAVALYFSIPSTRAVDEAKKEGAPARRYVAAEGKVEALPGLDVEVGSELIARIVKITAKEGERVEKGSVLVILDNRDISAKLKEAEGELEVERARLKEVASGARAGEIRKAEAALDAAKADHELAVSGLERYRGLYSEGVAPRAELDNRERAEKVARARVREADEDLMLLRKGPKKETLRLHEETVQRAGATVEYYRRLLEKTSVRAPISGTLIKRYLEEGETVIPEIPILAIADVERVWVNAEVDETDIGRISLNDPVEVYSDAYPGRVFKGEIVEISDYVGVRTVKPNNPAKNFDMKVIQVKIAFKEKSPFRLGMTVDVRITPGKDG